MGCIVGNVIGIRDFCTRKFDEASAEYHSKLSRVAELQAESKLGFAAQLIQDTGALRQKRDRYAARLQSDDRLRPAPTMRANKITITMADGSTHNI